ncbi:PREDICTED: uncharacterized protein LOC109473769 isoform X1 [Branchiostoma belcheri]|uniref:Uncharacterized protein LOC109473769 isoform X1 n=1 Tax=Branchiostoma belcheri TaxID=7741 RepID=A0A6P4YYM7_BRABE|nr:PREDICTED: uncharacterized protein LOC109473769 isoform X1 [Branchiostoma belcheri]XP_019629378.1 PREDICTED: uncharacterized protein LOC109473769 isoform X1 [Branchiostoma belcheri]XP_019629389.1 PREDICTED: uncharacterized protein LOC109473769 isoform X1 [Branchiostoma belcheri]XP_019629397.1 PREDICTED: uncharacterized protein LOC109473769 isoform X1 [Branchiostoma belcheri]
MDQHGQPNPQRRNGFYDDIQMIISQYDAASRIIKRVLMYMARDEETRNAFLLDREETALEPRKEDPHNDNDVIFLSERRPAVEEDHKDEVARTFSDEHADDDVIFLFERRPAFEEPRPRPPPCAHMRTGKH